MMEYKVLYSITSRLFKRLKLSRMDGTYMNDINKLAKTDVLILDDFFFSSRRRHTSSVSAFLLNRSSDLNRCGRSRHLARKLSLRRKRSSPNVFEMAATETITSIILIKLIRVSLGTVRHPRRFKIVVIDIQITLKQMLRDFIGIRVN